MVYYGPWQESRIHTEVFTLKDSDESGRTIELLGEAPTVRSGWDANNLAGLQWTAPIGSEAAYKEGGIGEPPPADPALSAAAFVEMMEGDVGAGGGGAMQYQMTQTGGQYPSAPLTWFQTQAWAANGVGYRVWFNWDLAGDNRGVRYAIPPGMDDTDDYYLELEEHAGPDKPVEIVEATVLASPALVYRLFVKDAAETAEPFLLSAVAGGGPSSSMSAARAHPDADDDVTLNHAILNDLAENGVPVLGDDWSLDGRMPSLAVLYDGPDLSVATLDSEHGWDETHQGQPVRIRIRYRWPRWRKVFYEVPYRRITQRGDSLAGGATRVGGRTKTIQGSNRRGAGSII